MSLSDQINEMRSLSQEIAMLRKKKQALEARHRELSSQVLGVLKETNEKGVKMKDNTVLRVQDKPAFLPKRKKDKESDSLRLLSHYGVNDPKKVLLELRRVQHGDATVKSSLKFENNTNGAKKRKNK